VRRPRRVTRRRCRGSCRRRCSRGSVPVWSRAACSWRSPSWPPRPRRTGGGTRPPGADVGGPGGAAWARPRRAGRGRLDGGEFLELPARRRQRAQPALPDLGQRYAELLRENVGQPGYRELLVVAHDLDARSDIVFALLNERERQAFFQPPEMSGDDRAREAWTSQRRRSRVRRPVRGPDDRAGHRAAHPAIRSRGPVARRAAPRDRPAGRRDEAVRGTAPLRRAPGDRRVARPRPARPARTGVPPARPPPAARRGDCQRRERRDSRRAGSSRPPVRGLLHDQALLQPARAARFRRRVRRAVGPGRQPS